MRGRFVERLKLEVRSWRYGVGGWRLESGDWRLEAGVCSELKVKKYYIQEGNYQYLCAWTIIFGFLDVEIHIISCLFTDDFLFTCSFGN